MKAAEGKRGGIIGSLDSSADERIHSKALALAWLPWCCWFLAQWREMTRSRALVALKRLGTRARSVRTRENAVLSLARGVTALTKRESMLHSLCSLSLSRSLARSLARMLRRFCSLLCVSPVGARFHGPAAYCTEPLVEENGEERCCLLLLAASFFL